MDLEICMHVSNLGSYGEPARAFLSGLIERLYVHEDFIHVAMTDFGTSYNVRWGLGQYYNAANAANAASVVSLTSGTGDILQCFYSTGDVFYIDRSTNTDQELIIGGDRAWAPNVLLIITDTPSPSALSTLVAARDSVLGLVDVVALVGFDGADATELATLATDSFRYLITGETYNLFNSGNFELILDYTADMLCPDHTNGMFP